MIFTTERFFEIAIGETVEWDLNPLPLNSVQMLELTDLSGHELNLHSEPTLYSNSSFLGCSVWDIILTIVFVSHHLFQSKFFWGNHMGVAEWTVIYGIHHWRILWINYRNLAWVGFDPRTTEFHSGALTDWGIRSRVQLALTVDFLQPF